MERRKINRMLVKQSQLATNSGRKKREQASISIRKHARDARLGKRRNMMMTSQNDSDMDMFRHADRSAKIKELLTGVYSNDVNLQEQATEGFRKLLSIDGDPPIKQVIDAGVVPRLISFLHSPNHKLQYEALWALTNIASGTSEQTRYIVEKNCVPLFVRLLSSGNSKVREQACWALGNISGDGPKYRNMLLGMGTLKAIAAVLNDVLNNNSKPLSLLRIGTWALSNLCRGKPAPVFDMVKDAIPTVARLARDPDKEVLIDALWALSSLSDGKDHKQKAVVRSGVTTRLVQLLGLTNVPMEVQVPVLRTIGNLVSGDDTTTQVVINGGAIPYLTPLLSHQKSGIRKEACWAVSNLLAGTPQQISVCIDAKMFPKILNILYNDKFDIKKEAAWCIANAISGGSDDQIIYFVQNGCVRPLCDLLVLSDASLLDMALDAIDHVLEVGAQVQQDKSLPNNPYADEIEKQDGLDKIDNCQKHNNTEISERATSLINTYWPSDMSDDEGLAPSMNSDSFGFGLDSNNNNDSPFDF